MRSSLSFNIKITSFPRLRRINFDFPRRRTATDATRTVCALRPCRAHVPKSTRPRRVENLEAPPRQKHGVYVEIFNYQCSADRLDGLRVCYKARSFSLPYGNGACCEWKRLPHERRAAYSVRLERFNDFPLFRCPHLTITETRCQ